MSSIIIMHSHSNRDTGLSFIIFDLASILAQIQVCSLVICHFLRIPHLVLKETRHCTTSSCSWPPGSHDVTCHQTGTVNHYSNPSCSSHLHRYHNIRRSCPKTRGVTIVYHNGEAVFWRRRAFTSAP